MKKGDGIIFGIVLVLALILCHFEQVEAKQKQNEKSLKQEWAKKTEEFSYETVTIEKGKTYTLKELIKPVSQRKSILYDLNEKLNKGYKITISGKGLLLKNKTISGKKPLVKKKTIRADKVGEYWLKVKLKDSFHLFRVEAVDKYFNVKENEVAKIIIADYEEHLNEGYRISEPIRVEITDPFQIRQIVSKLKMPKYAFSFARTDGSVPCIDEYNVGFYASDGRRLAQYIMMPFKMLNSKCVRKAENCRLPRSVMTIFINYIKICCHRFRNVHGNKERKDNMKQRLLIFSWVLVTMILLLLPSEHVKINAKIKNYEKPLRQECLVKDRHFYEEWIVIQKGKYYALQDVLRVYGTKYKSAKELLNQIKNNRNVVCFGEGLKIRKNKFMAKKPGEYKLKIKTEDECHVFALRIAEPFCQMRLDGVVKIVISQRTMGKTTSMEITDPIKVNGITSKLMQTKYVLDCTKTLRKRVGCFWGYDVALYDARDHLVDYFSMTSNTLCNSVAEWRSDSHFAKECFEFVDKTYKDALVLIPERLW